MVRESEYERRKDELPDICFATRYPVDWNLMRDGKHHLDSVADSFTEIQFEDEEVKTHPV